MESNKKKVLQMAKKMTGKKEGHDAFADAKEWGKKYRESKRNATTSQARAEHEKKYGRVSDWNNPKH